MKTIYLPLHADGHANEWTIYGKNDWPVANLHNDDGTGAKFIVRAVNSHADMLSALEAIEAHCRNENGLKGSAHAEEGQRIRAQARAAIRRAKGEG
jgi:hypothetical protein